LSLDGEDLNAEELALLATTFPRLQRLAVSFARELDAGALHELASLKSLDCLTLRKASKPTESDWAAFFLEQRCPSASSSSPSPVLLTADCGVLEEKVGWRLLNVAECEQLSDVAAGALASCGQMPRLAELDLSWCWQLTDEGLGTLLDAAPGLRFVKLAGIKSVTGASLVPCCRMPGLLELDCTSCNKMQDLMLEFLHRLFAGPPGSGVVDALPGPLWIVEPLVAEVVTGLWARRSRAQEGLKVKNYYAEYLENWSQLKPAREVCSFVEVLLGGDVTAGAYRSRDG